MTDDPPPEDFDYGEKLDDGQYENHPTTDEGEFVQPVRRAYVHDECANVTRVNTEIAESIARDPHQYNKTFCASCGDYVPVSTVSWKRDGASWEIEDEHKEDWMEGT